MRESVMSTRSQNPHNCCEWDRTGAKTEAEQAIRSRNSRHRQFNLKGDDVMKVSSKALLAVAVMSGALALAQGVAASIALLDTFITSSPLD